VGDRDIRPPPHLLFTFFEKRGKTMKTKEKIQYGSFHHLAEIIPTATASDCPGLSLHVEREPGPDTYTQRKPGPLRANARPNVQRYAAPAEGDSELLKRIIDAIGALDWVQWCKAKMAEQAPANEGGGEIGIESPEPIRPERQEPERLAKQSESIECRREPDASEHYARKQSDHVARLQRVDAFEAGREEIARRALQYAERHGCSYEAGLLACGSSLPTEIVGATPV
jgi:hypothetical protein